jgi:hypothetical protein
VSDEGFERLRARIAEERARDIELAARAEAEARFVEAEGRRIREHRPPDPLAERRRLEMENAAAFAAEVERESEQNRRVIEAHRKQPEPAQEQQSERPNWVTNWRTPT